jgi:hypothetical protein
MPIGTLQIIQSQASFSENKVQQVAAQVTPHLAPQQIANSQTLQQVTQVQATNSAGQNIGTITIPVGSQSGAQIPQHVYTQLVTQVPGQFGGAQVGQLVSVPVSALQKSDLANGIIPSPATLLPSNTTLYTVPNSSVLQSGPASPQMTQIQIPISSASNLTGGSTLFFTTNSQGNIIATSGIPNSGPASPELKNIYNIQAEQPIRIQGDQQIRIQTADQKVHTETFRIQG